MRSFSSGSENIIGNSRHYYHYVESLRRMHEKRLMDRLRDVEMTEEERQSALSVMLQLEPFVEPYSNIIAGHNNTNTSNRSIVIGMSNINSST